MARVFNSAKTLLQSYPAYSKDLNQSQVRSKDINEFIISTISPENGKVLETVILNETNLPFQPIVTPVSQSITKYYYPGGQKDRIPTIQILGSMDNEVTLNGRFKATKIANIENRTEPVTMSRILTRLVKEGNVCLFVLGNWIKYGILTNFTPTYRTDSDIDYAITITVIGNTNPFNKTVLRPDDPNVVLGRVFSNDNTFGILDAISSITDDINNNRKELESSYLPKATLNPFTIKGLLAELAKLGPVGNIISIGESIYSEYMIVLKAIDAAIDLVEEFDDIVEKTSFQITKVILGLTSQVSRLRAVEENLFVSYTNVKNATNLRTFQRLGAFTSLFSVVNASNKASRDLANVSNSIDNSQFSSISQTYVATSNDTYQSIATKFYGSWERWEELKQLNGYGDDLNGGEIIIIPS